MSHRIIWLAAMFTIAYWLGSVVGCSSNQMENDNYKILEQDQPMFDPRHNPDQPGATAPADETAPSLDGIDRSGWAAVTVGPEVGRIDKTLPYFEDNPIHGKRPTSADPLADAEWAGWDKANSLAVLGQPVKTAWDLGTFPVRIAMDPPRHITARSPLDLAIPDGE